MEPTRTINADARFFFDHAGYSHDPKTETEAEGRTRCAESLAAAESVYLAAHRLADVGIEWSDDDDGWSDYRCDAENGRDGIEEVQTIETACIWHRTESGDVEYLASLGGIYDADTDYRRVVRAELASECHEQLQAIINACEGA